MHRKTSAFAILSSLALAPVALAGELATITMETQALDLDTGAVLETDLRGAAEPAGGDVMFANNADRTPHAVVFPAAEGVTLAFVDDVSFAGVSAEDVDSLSFSAEPADMPMENHDTVVVRTPAGGVFKLGNLSEDGFTVRFNYAQLQ